jgi:hypothetical protein
VKNNDTNMGRKNEIQVVEDQLVLADSMKNKLIELETKKKR